MLATPANDQRYYYDPTAKTLTPYSLDAKYHDPYIDKGVQQISYSDSSGLVYKSGAAKDQWNYINKDVAPGYAAAEANNFGAGNTGGFRARNEGEDMYSYLQAKQAYETQQTGSSATKPGVDPSTIGGSSQQPNPSNPFYGIPAELSANMTYQDAVNYWKTGQVQAPENSRILGSTEFEGLQTDWRQAGLTPQEIEANFLIRDASGNIYLREESYIIQTLLTNKGLYLFVMSIIKKEQLIHI